MQTSWIGRLRLVTCLLLCSCQQSPEASGPRSSGRFAGIGVFDAGKLWAQMTGSSESGDPTVAKIADDEHIIVVLDSHTGEVRQCGDHSGFCVKMNPWTGPQGALPVKLEKHASDFADSNEIDAVNVTDAK